MSPPRTARRPSTSACFRRSSRSRTRCSARSRRLSRRAAREAVPASAEVTELTERRPSPQPDASGWNLDDLTRLVEERADEFPDRADEWRYTLFYLPMEAGIDGTLPSQFDSL